MLFYSPVDIWSQIFKLAQHPIDILLQSPPIFAYNAVIIHIFLYSIPLWVVFSNLKKIGIFFSVMVFVSFIISFFQPITAVLTYLILAYITHYRCDEDAVSFWEAVGYTFLIWVIIPFVMFFLVFVYTYTVLVPEGAHIELITDSTTVCLFNLFQYLLGYATGAFLGLLISVPIFAFIHMLKIIIKEKAYGLMFWLIFVLVVFLTMLFCIIFGYDFSSIGLEGIANAVKTFFMLLWNFYGGSGTAAFAGLVALTSFSAIYPDMMANSNDSSDRKQCESLPPLKEDKSGLNNNLIQRDNIPDNSAPLLQASNLIESSDETEQIYMVQAHSGEMTYAERIKIKPNPQLHEWCRASEQIYNIANYILFHIWKERGKHLLRGKSTTRQLTLNYNSIASLLALTKDPTLLTDSSKRSFQSDVLEAYHMKFYTDDIKQSFIEKTEKLPAQTTQQLLMVICKNWESFFALEKDFSENPGNYPKDFKVRPPKYKRGKSEEWLLIFTNQNSYLKEAEDSKSVTYKGVFPSSPRAFVHFTKKPKDPTLSPDKERYLPPVQVRTAIFHDHFEIDEHKSFYSQIRILPRKTHYIIEVLYLKRIEPAKVDPNAILSIDTGVNNLMTMVSNKGLPPVIVKGQELKALNQWYNKLRAKYRSKREIMINSLKPKLEIIRQLETIKNQLSEHPKTPQEQQAAIDAMRIQFENELQEAQLDPSNPQKIAVCQQKLQNFNTYRVMSESELFALRTELNRIIYADSRRMQRITAQRERKMTNWLHIASRFVIDYCKQQGIGTICVGKNKYWKQETEMGRRNNQNFVTIPHTKLIKMIGYKAEQAGIQFLCNEEGHTSKCSMIDNETIQHHDKYVGHRLSRGKRGLFIAAKINPQTGKPYIIHADVNGAFNIGRKWFPGLFDNISIQELLRRPLRYSINELNVALNASI
jgi:IS605 OrfB family transposase